MGASVGRKEEEPRGGGEERRGLGRREEGAQVGRGRRGKSVGCGLISRKPDSTGHISQGNQSALQGPKLRGWGWRGAASQHSQGLPEHCPDTGRVHLPLPSLGAVPTGTRPWVEGWGSGSHLPSASPGVDFLWLRISSDFHSQSLVAQSHGSRQKRGLSDV